MTKKTTTAIAVALALVLVAGGCSQKYSAERDGKKLGEAACDVRNADSRDEADAALDDLNAQLEDVGNKYSLFTAEDRQDVQNNLADLHEHAIQGNTALMQQDLAVLQRSIANIADDTNEVTRAVREGILEGLADCTR